MKVLAFALIVLGLFLVIVGYRNRVDELVGAFKGPS